MRYGQIYNQVVLLGARPPLPQDMPDASGGTLNTWRSGDDGRPVTERLQVRF
jgi:hypothetical protein